nr:hypothetical protein [Streptomyces pratensis]
MTVVCPRRLQVRARGGVIEKPGLVLENGPGRLRSRASLPWNFGVVEGHDNRIKMLKRQMLGRAGFAHLRKSGQLAN